MKNIVCLFIVLIAGKYLYAQSKANAKLHFTAMWKGSPVRADSLYEYRDGNISFNTFKFYVSQISFYYRDKKLAREKNVYLLDLLQTTPGSISFNFLRSGYDSISFLLGTDSLTNVQSSLAGDLDPVKGMYWTWQSGYINAKLEGTCSLSPVGNKEFEYHVGGYMYPFASSRQVGFAVSEKNINILFALDKLFEELNVTSFHHLMSPGTEAVMFSERMTRAFYVK